MNKNIWIFPIAGIESNAGGLKEMLGQKTQQTQNPDSTAIEFERVHSTANAVTLQMIDFINKYYIHMVNKKC